jgi:hypothetical protein
LQVVDSVRLYRHGFGARLADGVYNGHEAIIERRPTLAQVLFKTKFTSREHPSANRVLSVALWNIFKPSVTAAFRS